MTILRAELVTWALFYVLINLVITVKWQFCYRKQTFSRHLRVKTHQADFET